MIIEKVNFPTIIPDNDDMYLALLEALINSIDEASVVEAKQALNGIHIRISPSIPRHSQLLLTTIRDFHYMLGIRIEFSKSIRTSSIINFTINYD